MNKEKLTYLSPETETLVVRFEESILQVISPGGKKGSSGWAGGGFPDEDTNDYGDL